MNERSVGDVILKVDNISLSFGVMKVLDNISFDIREGEIRSIIGPNGAGKSSMLNVINGFYHPQEGTITFKGIKRRSMRPHQQVIKRTARTRTVPAGRRFTLPHYKHCGPAMRGQFSCPAEFPRLAPAGPGRGRAR